MSWRLSLPTRAGLESTVAEAPTGGKTTPDAVGRGGAGWNGRATLTPFRRERRLLRTYKGIAPKLGRGVYVDESAQVIGDVELDDDASVWMNATLRGDVNHIRIGRASNIQDNCVVHVQHDDWPTVVADHVTVGHSVTLHGCRIGSRCLIGIGAIVLNGAEVGEESIVAAGALVPEGAKIPAGSLVMGVPGKVRRALSDEERSSLLESAKHYLEYKETYLAESRKQ